MVAASYAKTHGIGDEREVRIPKEESKATMDVLSLCFTLTLSWTRWAWTNEWFLGFKVKSLREDGALKHRFLIPLIPMNQIPESETRECAFKQASQGF